MPDAPDEIVYRHETYVPLVGSTFDIERPDGDPVAVELVDATVLAGRGECFSLVFCGPTEVSLEQRTYRMQHRELGDFSLFLVPLGPRENGGLAFEAIINRLEP